MSRIKILTFNVALWSSFQNSHKIQKIKELISHYDVICLQEVITYKYDILRINAIEEFKKMSQYTIIYDNSEIINSGLVIMSRYPVNNIKIRTYQAQYGISSFFSKKFYLQCDLLIGREVLTVYNTHFNSKEGAYDLEYLEMIQALQAMELIGSIIKNNQKFILCGDFNVNHNIFDLRCPISNIIRQITYYKYLPKTPTYRWDQRLFLFIVITSIRVCQYIIQMLNFVNYQIITLLKQEYH
jgi:exonuclease III